MAGYDHESLLKDIMTARMDEAVRSLREEALRTGYPRLIENLLNPVLRRIGQCGATAQFLLPRVT